MSDTCKATITYRDVKIVVEGPRDYVDDLIARYAAPPPPPITSKDSNKFLLTDGNASESDSNILSEHKMIATKQP